MNPSRSQRWRDHQDRYVPNASVINPTDYTVDAVPEAQAKAFVTQHHYSGSFPAARLSVGLFRGAQLAGVAVFSVPMNNRAVPLHTGLEDPKAGVDLGRFVLLDDVAGNGETWFLSRAFKVLRREKPGVVGCISYADPLPRRTATGLVIKPGHVGMIYQHLGAAYRGRAKARVELLTPDGQPFSERAICKIRNLEQGHAYATDDLVRRGARKPHLGEDLTAWLADLRATGFLEPRKHPGNHVYAFPLTHGAKCAGRRLASAPYPQREAA